MTPTERAERVVIERCDHDGNPDFCDYCAETGRLVIAAIAQAIEAELERCIRVIRETVGDTVPTEILVANLRTDDECSNPSHWDEPHPCPLCADAEAFSPSDAGSMESICQCSLCKPNPTGGVSA